MKDKLARMTATAVLALGTLTATAAPLGGEGVRVGLGTGVLLVLIYATVGAAALFLCFKGFDKALTGIDLEKEIEKGNVAAAILSGTVILGIAIVIAAAIVG